MRNAATRWSLRTCAPKNATREQKRARTGKTPKETQGRQFLNKRAAPNSSLGGFPQNAGANGANEGNQFPKQKFAN